MHKSRLKINSSRYKKIIFIYSKRKKERIIIWAAIDARIKTKWVKRQKDNWRWHITKSRKVIKFLK